MARTIIQGTVGLPGCGKTYTRGVCWLVDDWLRYERGLYITNLPIFPDRVAEFAARLHSRDPLEQRDLEETYLARIVLIPSEVVASWRKGKSGPWEYLKALEAERGVGCCDGAHVAIDEFHEVCRSRKMRQDLEEAWNEFAGTLRHGGISLEMITQHWKQIHSCMRTRCELKRFLVGASEVRDPFLNVRFGDWYELRGALSGTGVIERTIVREERNIDDKFVPCDEYAILIDPDRFPLYDSFSARDDQLRGGSQHQCDILGRWGTVRWFLARHWFKLVWRVACLFGFWWVFWGGGGRWAFTLGQKVMTSLISSTMVTDRTGFKGLAPSPSQGSASSSSAASRPSVASASVASSAVPVVSALPAAAVAAAVASADPDSERMRAAHRVWLDALRRDLEAGEVLAGLAAIGDGWALTGFGERLAVGHVIQRGPCAGQKVGAIDYENGTVELDRGCLRLRSSRLRKAASGWVGDERSGGWALLASGESPLQSRTGSLGGGVGGSPDLSGGGGDAGRGGIDPGGPVSDTGDRERVGAPESGQSGSVGAMPRP